ncbi:MAG: hypothetical protein AB7O96_03820 [Pseudobdellovibrionaceae bacterium]
MQLILIATLIAGMSWQANARGDDPIIRYCEKQYGSYPSLYESCLKEFGDLYLDPPMTELCEKQYLSYPSLLKSCFQKLGNKKVQRGFAQLCKKQYESYPSLHETCLVQNSKPFNPSMCDRE